MTPRQPRSLPDALAGAVAAYRITAGLTQQELAERMTALGFTTWSQTTVAEVEGRGRKRRVAVDELLGLSEVLGVPVLMLLMDPDGETVALTSSWQLPHAELIALVMHGEIRWSTTWLETIYSDALKKIEAQQENLVDQQRRLKEALRELRRRQS